MKRLKPKRSSGFAIVELLAFLLVLVLLVVAGWQILKRISKSGGENPATVQQSELGTLKGVSLSPKSFGSEDFAAFLGQAVKAGKIITWAGEWTMLERSGSAPFTVAKLAGQYGYQPIIIVGVDASVAQDKQRFINAVQSFASTYKPGYIGLGNEVNRVHSKSPASYDAFKLWFGEAAASIRQKSPDTKVFTTFQYEELNGLKGGLFGGKNDESAAEWQLFDDFPSADLIALTTYPYIIYGDPDAIPADYYSRVKSHTTKPVAFTEIGWPSGTEAPGYESTPEEQSRFVTGFFKLTEGLGSEFVIWPFLYEQSLPKPFTTIGLISGSGEPKPALAVWQGVTFN